MTYNVLGFLFSGSNQLNIIIWASFAYSTSLAISKTPAYFARPYTLVHHVVCLFTTPQLLLAFI